MNDALGPHKSSLASVISNIRESQHKAVQPVDELSRTLNELSEAYQDITDNDNFETESNLSADQSSSENSNDGNTGKFID